MWRVVGGGDGVRKGFLEDLVYVVLGEEVAAMVPLEDEFAGGELVRPVENHTDGGEGGWVEADRDGGETVLMSGWFVYKEACEVRDGEDGVVSAEGVGDLDG